MDTPTPKPPRPHRRYFIIFLEILSVIAVLFFLLWVGVLWRLSQGPLNVDFLTHRLQKTLHKQQSDFNFTIQHTQLTWGGGFEPTELQMNQVQIDRADKTPVVAVDKIAIQLSKRYLIFGQFVPKVIKIEGLALRIVHAEDGSFNLNVASGNDITDNVSAPGDESPDAQNQDLLRSFLQKMQDQNLVLLGGLGKISITKAALFYQDKVHDLSWKSRDTSLTIYRTRDGLQADALANIDFDNAQPTPIEGRIIYNTRTKETSALITFDGINPGLIAQQSPSLAAIAGVQIPVKGSLTLELDSYFKPRVSRFIIGGGPGTFNAGNLYKAPLPVESFYAKGEMDLATLEGLIDPIKIDLKGPLVEASIRSVAQGNGAPTKFEIKATLSNTPMDDLHLYWPETLTPDPRTWVTTHLSKGMATKATLDATFSIDPKNPKDIQVGDVGGMIDFEGIKVDYYPPLLPALNAKGKATYDKKSFNINITGGQLGDMAVTKSTIHLTELDKQTEIIHALADISVSLSGPLKTALDVLDSAPLKYPSMLGISTADVSGNVDIDTSFKFPMHKALNVKDVHVTATAKAKDVSLKNVVSDLPITAGVADLNVDNGTLSAKGTALLDGMPTEFNWTQHFTTDSPVKSSIDAQLNVNGAVFNKFGVPSDIQIGGNMSSKITYIVNNDASSTLQFNGDASSASVNVPFAGYTKDGGVPGILGFRLHLKNNQPYKMDGLTFESTGTQLKGTLDFNDAGLQKASFDRLLLGNTDVNLTAELTPQQGYIVKVTGKQADFSKILDRTSKKITDEEMSKKVPPIIISLQLDSILTAKDTSILKPKMYLHRNEWQRIEQFEMDGSTGEKDTIYIRYMPVANGHSLRFEATNAGAALRALGITQTVRGGKITVDAKPYPKGGARDMSGTIIVSDFVLNKAPIVARLLNAISLTGIIDLLNGSGISFKKMRSNFTWQDRGQPSEPKNTRLIKLKDGQTSGSSLGLTFEGTIDNWNDIYDLNGTLVPVSDLNKLLSSIPLVGDVLTAGGEGVFAATYTIKGPADQPTVTVNPLSVLAPGILRKMFFEE